MFKSLLVVWKDKKSLLYYHVGTLNYDGEKYVFNYTIQSQSHRKVKEAIRNGYRPHPAFPDLYKEYISPYLFPAFDRRIPSSDRVDYDEILKALNLPENADRMDILRVTRGMLSGDAYSFEEPLRLNQNNIIETNFYISGMRHQGLGENWKSKVNVGDDLIAIPEPENDKDPYAVRIETGNGVKLGYIPGIYAQAVSALLRNNCKLKLTIKNIRPSFAPQWWVHVSLIGELSIRQLQYHEELDGLILKVA